MYRLSPFGLRTLATSGNASITLPKSLAGQNKGERGAHCHTGSQRMKTDANGVAEQGVTKRL